MIRKRFKLLLVVMCMTAILCGCASGPTLEDYYSENMDVLIAKWTPSQGKNVYYEVHGNTFARVTETEEDRTMDCDSHKEYAKEYGDKMIEEIRNETGVKGKIKIEIVYRYVDGEDQCRHSVTY